MSQLLPPWTPLQARETDQGVAVEVWGRTYRFADGPLPAGVATAGEEMLAAPMRLVGRADGSPIDWQTRAAFKSSGDEIADWRQSGSLLLQRDDAEATLLGWQASATLIVNTTVRVEFDGMMRVDLVVLPQRRTQPRVEELWLEVPLQPQRATLYTYWPTLPGRLGNSGAVPTSGLSLPFRPSVWLGWEEGGLGWFSESDRGWLNPRDTARTVEVIPGEATLLRLHLVDSIYLRDTDYSHPPRLPLTYTFGFQATPVKPMPRGCHERRLCHHLDYGFEKRPSPHGKTGAETELDRIARLGTRAVVFHEGWTPVQNYWRTGRESELRELACACHERGMKLLLYFGYELSSLAPGYVDLADEVLVKNVEGEVMGGWCRMPAQRANKVCYHSVWADRLAEGIADALDRYGADGVYLDGTTVPVACANERHGCGYRSADGGLHPTYPIFAVRQLIRRLYTVIHPRGGIIDAHQSTCLLMPALAFCHSYFDGEQFGVDRESDPLEQLPLAAFRAEFMGANFGIPIDFLGLGAGWRIEDLLYITLLHDVLPRPTPFGSDLEVVSPVWDAMSRFGAGEAEWHPYWRNQHLVEVEPETVKASLYLKRAAPEATRVLLVASNLSTQHEVQARIALDRLVAVCATELASCHDALSRERLPLHGRLLQVGLRPMTARLVIVE
ncbi:MAG: hypothetical protein AB1505_28650 [Candidatus Latescibacterota bacterium]